MWNFYVQLNANFMVIQPWNGKQIFQKILVLLDTYLFLEIVGNMDKGNALPIKTKIVDLFIGIKCFADPSKFLRM